MTMDGEVGSAGAGFWRALVEGSLDPVVVLDEDHRFRFASDALYSETGLGADEVIGSRFESVAVDADGSSVAERLDRNDAGGSEFGISLRTADGGILHTRARLRRERIDDTPVHVVMIRSTRGDHAAASALHRRVEMEQLLEGVQHRFIHAVPREIGAVVRWALEEVATYLGADRGYVLRFDPDTRTESMVHEWVGVGTEPEIDSYQHVSWDLAPAASRRNNDLWVSAVPDVSLLDGEWEVDRKFFEDSGLRSILELPIIIDGTPVGSLGFDWLAHLADWTEDDLTVLGMFASTFAQLLGRETAELELTRRATHDELTGLPNRVGLLQLVDGALAPRPDGTSPVVGVIVLDIDRFQVINDSLGNAAGDDLLRLVGARIRSIVRPDDAVARLGGDEFAVVMGGVIDEWSIAATGERLRDRLAEPFHFRGRTHLLTVSCGIATSEGGDGFDSSVASRLGAEELLRRAGAAMYRSKELGRARQTSFDVDLERRLSDRLDLDQRLRLASSRNEFEVHFQPEVDLVTGRTVGVEALLRWRVDGELRDAYTFIDVVEETGLIVSVGRWVLDEACRHAARWCEGRDDFAVRVNLSQRQLEHPGLIDEVRSVLSEYHLDPRRLCLEITETALMSNAESALGLLDRLDELGVALAIDDFGTGYSSLSHLKRFPVDVLKIDRSFVDGLPDDAEDQVIVATVVALAGALGMTVTAEGIETEAHAAALVAIGCDRGQGWLYSKAVAPEAIDARLAEEDGLMRETVHHGRVLD